MEFLEGGPCPGGIGRELTSHLRSLPLSKPSTPGTSVTLPDGVRQVTSGGESRPPSPTPGLDLSSGCGSSYAYTGFLTLQVGRQRPGGNVLWFPRW